MHDAASPDIVGAGTVEQRKKLRAARRTRNHRIVTCRVSYRCRGVRQVVASSAGKGIAGFVAAAEFAGNVARVITLLALVSMPQSPQLC